MEVLSLPAAEMNSMGVGPRETSVVRGSTSTAAAHGPGVSCDSCSLASTTTDLHDGIDPSQRTHHLLKHCLSQSQRGAALAQFHTGDPREAAKEIARMGQRELQAKFKASRCLSAGFSAQLAGRIVVTVHQLLSGPNT
jgi:hypothetical protein